MKERVRKYVDSDGLFLAIAIDEGDGYTIGWYDPSAYSFGLILDNDLSIPMGYFLPPNDSTEMVIAVETCQSFFREKQLGEPPQGEVFTFQRKKDAAECLRRINAKLWLWHREKKSPLPDWASKALENGWLPPKGGWEP
jgi:hypothetical protein